MQLKHSTSSLNREDFNIDAAVDRSRGLIEKGMVLTDGNDSM